MTVLESDTGASLGSLIGADQVDHPVMHRATFMAFFLINDRGEAVVRPEPPTRVDSRAWRPSQPTWREACGFVFYEATFREGELPSGAPTANGFRFYCGELLTQTRAWELWNVDFEGGIGGEIRYSIDDFRFGAVKLHDGRLLPLSRGDVVVTQPKG